MFVAVLFDAMGIGPHPTREEALAAAEEQFPGKPATVIRLLTTEAQTHSPTPPAARRYSTDLPHGHLSLTEANDLRARLNAALDEDPLRLRDLRKHMGPSEGSLRNLRNGTTRAPQLRVARLIDAWLDGLGAPAAAAPVNHPAAADDETPPPAHLHDSFDDIVAEQRSAAWSLFDDH